MLLFDRNAVLGTNASEAHFFSLPPSMFDALVLVRIFGVNALLFVPLGQRMGRLFNALPGLTAYAWDLAGSLTGTLCFGLFSLKLFSPVLGMAGVMGVYLALSARRRWLFDLPVFAATLAAILWNSDPNAIWSPYYYITVNQPDTPKVTESAPPADLLTMRDPPSYMVKVNQFGYHCDASLDSRRYTPGSPTYENDPLARAAVRHPLRCSAAGRDRVLVVGAGGGCDVEAALWPRARSTSTPWRSTRPSSPSRGRFNAGAPYSGPAGVDPHRRRPVLPGAGAARLRPGGLRLPRFAGALQHHEQRPARRLRLHGREHAVGVPAPQRPGAC